MAAFFRTLPISIFVIIFLITGCGGGSSKPSSDLDDEDNNPESETIDCKNLECVQTKFSLISADLNGENLTIVVENNYQEMSHPRVTNDGKWLAFNRYNTITHGECAEEKGSHFLNTEIRAVKMNGNRQEVALTTAQPGRLSSNSYWINDSYNFTYLEGTPATPATPNPTDKIAIKTSFRDSEMQEIQASQSLLIPPTIAVFDPQQRGSKIVFGGLYTHPTYEIPVKSIFTIDDDGQNISGKTIATNTNGDPVHGLQLALENDPKFSPDGSKIAFIRKINENKGFDHGWHIFVTSSDATPGDEINLSILHIGSDEFFNDAVPEWIDNETLIFNTIDVTNETPLLFDQKIFTMKYDGTERNEITLPAGFHYGHPFPYKDENNKTKIILSANKLDAECMQE